MRGMRAGAKIFVHALILWLLAGSAFARPVEEAVGAYKKGDYATALQLSRPLAERGDALAQTILAVMYANGQGVERDYVLAHMWWNLAAVRMPDADLRETAGSNRDLIAAKMTPEQIAEAQRLAREWKPNAK